MAIIGFFIGMFLILLVIVAVMGGILFKLLIGGACLVISIAIAKTKLQAKQKFLLIAITVVLAVAIIVARDYFPQSADYQSVEYSQQ